MIDVELTAILDGSAHLIDGRRVRWGAVVVSRSGHRPTVIGRACRIRRMLEPPVGAIVIRDPTLFAACIATAATKTAMPHLDPTVILDGCRAFRERAGGRHWLETVREMLHAEFMTTLRMLDIADRVAVHPVHLSRSFAHRFGTTMTSYLRDLRLARASELLLTTTQPLSRVALSTGFADHAHFTRTFVARWGMQPSALRRLVMSRSAA
jgi:AraC-like DNA-binding protein